MKKFEEKKAKAAGAASAPSKRKDKAEASKESALPDYVEDTPPGEKKSKTIHVSPSLPQALTGC